MDTKEGIDARLKRVESNQLGLSEAALCDTECHDMINYF
jgi:hypothetical protein